MNSVIGQFNNKPIVYAPSIANRKYKDFVVSKGNSIQKMFDSVAPAGDTIGRVCVMGFSEGCMGVRATLETVDASGVDAVFACDGIHSEYESDGGVGLSLLKPYIAFARIASGTPVSVDPNVKLLCVTHSSIVPERPSKTKPGKFERYPSTTETAAVLWLLGFAGGDSAESVDCPGSCTPKVNLNALAAVQFPSATFPIGRKIGAGVITDAGWSSRSDPTPGLGNGKMYSWNGYADGWYSRLAGNNLYIFGWGRVDGDKIKTQDPTGNRDHVFQANIVLPLSVRQILLNRWNGTCDPISGLGLGDTSASSCTLPRGRPFNADGPPGPLPGIDAVGGGSVIVPSPVGVDTPPTEEEMSTLQKAVVFSAGAAAGYYAAKWVSGLSSSRS